MTPFRGGPSLFRQKSAMPGNKTWRIWAAGLLVWLVAGTAATGDQVWGYLIEIRTHRLHSLTGEVVLVGRSPKSRVVLPDPHVSRQHAEIRRTAEALVVVDLGSTNGSRLNGQRLVPEEPVPLKSGDFLELAGERILFHERKVDLWADALQHILLGRFVRLKVGVSKDREVKALGAVRGISGLTRAGVDVQTGNIQIDHATRDGGEEQGEEGFRAGEAAFVGEAAMARGSLRLSLWGLARGEGLVSRRASFSKLKHGQLLIWASGSTEEEARALFERGWESEGLVFLAPLLTALIEPVAEGDVDEIALELARQLLEQPGPTAALDAARTLAFRHRRDPLNPELPGLVGRARARWVKTTAAGRTAQLTEEERAALRAALSECQDWARKAAELGAQAEITRKLKTDIAEAEKLLGRLP